MVCVDYFSCVVVHVEAIPSVIIKKRSAGTVLTASSMEMPMYQWRECLYRMKVVTKNERHKYEFSSFIIQKLLVFFMMCCI